MTLGRDLGENSDPALPIDALFKHARAALDRLVEEWGATQGGIARMEEAKTELARARRQKDVARAKLEQALADWPQAIAPLALREDASPSEAKAALKLWREVLEPRQALLSERRRIETMEADVASFQAAVDALISSVAPDLLGRQQRDALTALSEKLTASRNASTKRNTLEEKRRRREETRAKLLRRSEGADATLAAARHALGAADTAALLPTLDRLERRFEYESALEGAKRDLLESADGRDEEALRQEQAGFELRRAARRDRTRQNCRQGNHQRNRRRGNKAA